MQFALLIYHTPEEFVMRENEYKHPHLDAWRAYCTALVEAGVYITGNPLEEWAARRPGASVGAVEVRPLSPDTMRCGFTG